MTDSNYTAFALVMDRSGSMDSIQNEAENAINRFVDEQKELPGKATLTFARFDDQYELVFSNIPISEVTKLELAPRGMTALFDATGRTIVSFGEALAAMPEDQRPGKILFVIVTDGLENASKEWSSEKLKTLINEQQEQWNWEFIYLAANVDAGEEAEKIGIPRKMSKDWVTNTAGTRAMGQSVSGYASSYRSTGKGVWDNDPNPIVDDDGQK